MMATDAPAPKTAGPQAAGVVVPNRPSLLQRIGARIIWLLVRAVSLTLRIRWRDNSGLPAGPVIYALWHNRLALCLTAYCAHAKKRGHRGGLAALISASKDGAFLSGIFECFGVQAVRGSTSRRGRQALLELTRWIRRGHDIGITPDGPRGPCYVVQDGVIYLAQLSGLPIVPLSYQLGWKIRLKSWDRFQLPLPFSRCEIFFGTPIHVPREVSEEEREIARRNLECALKDISRDQAGKGF